MQCRSICILFTALFSISLLIGCAEKTEVRVISDKKNQPQQANTTKNKENQPDVLVSDVLIQVKELANNGKVIGGDPFAIGSSRAEVENAWGKSTPGNEESEDYLKQNISVYYEFDQVDQIITKSSEVTNFTYEEVVKSLGKPVNKKSDEGLIHLFYNAGPDSKYDLTVSLNGIDQKMTDITVGNKPTPDPDQVPQNQ